MRITSRPEIEEEPGVALEWLSHAELELIAAYLWPTRLGTGISQYRDAAFTLMEKIVSAKGNHFLSDAAMNVDLYVVDKNGHIVQSLSQAVEFIV